MAGLFSKKGAQFWGGEIDPASFARFRVGQLQHSGVGEIVFGRIGYGAADDIVFACDTGESGIVAVILEIGNQKDDRAAMLDNFEAVKCFCDIGFAGGVFCGRKDFTHDTGDGVSTSLRGNLLDDPVGEENQADVVLIVDGCEGQKSGDFGGQIGLCAGAGTEIQRAGNIDEELDRQLPLFREALDLGDSCAGGDIPIDGAHVVANLVLANFIEFDAFSLERSMVIARKALVDEPPCQDAD